MFNLKIGEATEEQASEIDDLHRRWERDILWRANNLESERHERVCVPTSGSWCKCRTRQEEIHEWEDWILDNYDQADEHRRWEIPRAVLARVSPSQRSSVEEDNEKSGHWGVGEMRIV